MNGAGLKILRVVGVAVISLMLAACLGDVPSSGPIGFGRENSGQPQGNFVRTIVAPPAAGADPDAIVRGFLTAAAGDIGSFATARLYLAPEIRDDWRPQSEIRVLTDRDLAWEYDSQTAPGLVRSRGRQVATINAQGEYRLDPQAYSQEIRLRLVNREWRISQLPDGLTLTESELARAYRSVSIFFIDSSRSILVPNQIYLPVRPALATSMVRALLRGPTPWLAPAVRTALPEGTGLTVNAVPIVNGIATVDLSENVARASSSARTLLSAQLIHTLRQIPEIRGVQINAGGVPLAVPGMERIQPISAWGAFAPESVTTDGLVYLSTPTGLHSLSLAGTVAVPRVFSSSIPDYTRGFRWPAVSYEGDRVVAIDGAGNLVTGEISLKGDEVLVADLSPGVATAGADVMRPRWDITATYWTAVRGTSTLRVFAGRIGTEEIRVETPVWGEGRVSAFAISRDGTRAVVARSEGSRSQIYLLRVVREARGESLSLQDPLRIATLAGSVTDLAWPSATSVMALAGQPGLQRQIWLVAADGSAPAPTGPPLNAVAIAVAPGRSLIAETVDRRLVVLRDQRWIDLTTGRDPSYAP